MIDITKKYQTRNGKEVRLYANDGDHAFPIHGAYRFGEYWVVMAWTSEGGADAKKKSEWDLVEIKPVITRQVWIKINKNGRISLFDKEADAKRLATNAVALVPIEFSYKEGDGL